MDPEINETESPETTEVSLFDEVKPTEEELMGIEPSGEEEKEEEESSSSEESQSGEEEESASAESEEESSSEEEEKPDEKPAAPPKGYVEKGALKAERTLHGATKEKIVILEQELSTLRAEANVPNETFVKLSKEEFEELLEKEPTEAQKYRVREADYDKAKSERDKLNKESNSRNVARVRAGHDLIKELVPDIYVKDSESSKNLSKFAQENGFKSGPYLSAFTDPRTVIYLPGQKTPTVLGEGAAHFVEFINSTFNSLKDVPKETVEEIETRVREEVIKELKDKQDSSGESQSLGDLGGSGDTPQVAMKVDTEDDVLKLSPKQLKAFRAGEEVFVE